MEHNQIAPVRSNRMKNFVGSTPLTRAGGGIGCGHGGCCFV